MVARCCSCCLAHSVPFFFPVSSFGAFSPFPAGLVHRRLVFQFPPIFWFTFSLFLFFLFAQHLYKTPHRHFLTASSAAIDCITDSTAFFRFFFFFDNHPCLSIVLYTSLGFARFRLLFVARFLFISPSSLLLRAKLPRTTCDSLYDLKIPRLISSLPQRLPARFRVIQRLSTTFRPLHSISLTYNTPLHSHRESEDRTRWHGHAFR